MKKIAILGSTGSIGTQTLEVVRENQDIQVMALAAGSNIELLEAQIREFRPVLAAVWEEEKAKELRENIKDLNVKVVSGMDGLFFSIPLNGQFCCIFLAMCQIVKLKLFINMNVLSIDLRDHVSLFQPLFTSRRSGFHFLYHRNRISRCSD